MNGAEFRTRGCSNILDNHTGSVGCKYKDVSIIQTGV